MAIPLFVLEEHHEAFLLWQLAKADGTLPARGNTLLHVDEHSDLGIPRLRQSVTEAVEDRRRLYAFTFDELSCNDFIVPAAALGLFDRIVWLKRSHVSPSQPAGRPGDAVLTVGFRDGSGRRLDISRHAPAAGPADAPAGSTVRYRRQTVADPLPQTDHIILSIDLSYFSCETEGNVPQRYEITRDEFQAFECDRFHPLRRSSTRVVEEQGRHYLVMNDSIELAPTPLRADEAQIRERISALADFLQRRAVVPRVIHVARSRFSSYTPADQCPWIEGLLLERLDALYRPERRDLDEQCATLGLLWPLAQTGTV